MSIKNPPLTPPECDLTDFPFMPLEIARLRRSKAWLVAKRIPELGFYMLNLWAASWHDRPAASLEDDDDVLADLAMCDPKRWKKVKDDVMRGWVKCDDGRFYHPVVAQKALDAWKAKQSQRQRTEAARAAREHKRIQNASQESKEYPSVNVTSSVTEANTEHVTNSVTDKVTDVVTESKREGQGEREGEGYLKTYTPSTDGVDSTAVGADQSQAPPLPDSETENQQATAGSSTGAASMATQFAVAVRSWEKARGKVTKVTSTEPRLYEWADAGLELPSLREAYDLAVADREAAGDSGAINAGFLNVFVDRVLHPPKAREKPDRWRSSDDGIERKGREIGLPARPGESYQQYAQRIEAKLRTNGQEHAA